MAIVTIRPNGEHARIPQGSNNPLVIEFDEPITIPELSISLWCDGKGTEGQPLKVWSNDDITIEDENKAVCPLTEEETSAFPSGTLILEIKGLDENGYTVFWQQFTVQVVSRRDKIIKLTGDE